MYIYAKETDYRDTTEKTSNSHAINPLLEFPFFEIRICKNTAHMALLALKVCNVDPYKNLP